MRKLSVELLLTALFVMFLCDKPFAKNGEPGTILVKKCVDFEITGEGNASAWENTEWTQLIQRKQMSNDYDTRVKVLYSETGIYFLFDCEDKKLTSTITIDNEDLWDEDVVEIFLWTDESFPVYFEYELSPLNYELPILVPNDKGNFLGWLPWHYDGERRTRHETSVRGGKKESGAKISGWVAEIFIPYALLTPLPNVPPQSNTKWRANMYRIDYDQGQATFSWQETGGSFHEYKKFGTK